MAVRNSSEKEAEVRSMALMRDKSELSPVVRMS